MQVKCAALVSVLRYRPGCHPQAVPWPSLRVGAVQGYFVLSQRWCCCVCALLLPCRAFFVKVSAWEDELVDMLEGQAGPVAIRDIVSVFKDRIHSERDKSEFKALCDKWTGVVEYPAGRWVWCACCGVLWQL